jgi:hypothetical protein
MDRNTRRGTIKLKWVAQLGPKDAYQSIFILKNNNHAFRGCPSSGLMPIHKRLNLKFENFQKWLANADILGSI